MRKLWLRRKHAGGIILPQVGPFADLARTPIGSLTDLTLGTATLNTTRTSPRTRKTLTINSGGVVSPASGSTWAIFLWCHEIRLNGTLNANGFGGGDGDQFSILGGSGGGVGSGGGGGAGDSGGGGGGPFAGGSGGSGGNGVDGTGNDAPGTGGTGRGNTYNSGFTYGNGGNGGPDSGATASGGAGGNGFGGGGAGGGIDSTAGMCFGGGGGGGAGLLVAVCNILTRTAAAQNLFRANGGAGGAGDSTVGTAYDGGAGGGGVLWVAARKYDGNLTTGQVNAGGAGATAGTINLYEIERDGSLTAHTDWTDTWNNFS